MSVRIICRAIILDPQTGRILLVRNRDASFWYPPGGGWEEAESLRGCLAREAAEETGISILPFRFLYVQEFSPTPGETNLELFWLAHPTGGTELNPDFTDIGGIVEERCWFTRNEMRNLNVFPRRLTEEFWNTLGLLQTIPDPFIGG